MLGPEARIYTSIAQVRSGEYGYGCLARLAVTPVFIVSSMASVVCIAMIVPLRIAGWGRATGGQS